MHQHSQIRAHTLTQHLVVSFERENDWNASLTLSSSCVSVRTDNRNDKTNYSDIVARQACVILIRFVLAVQFFVSFVYKTIFDGMTKWKELNKCCINCWRIGASVFFLVFSSLLLMIYLFLVRTYAYTPMKKKNKHVYAHMVCYFTMIHISRVNWNELEWNSHQNTRKLSIELKNYSQFGVEWRMRHHFFSIFSQQTCIQ